MATYQEVDSYITDTLEHKRLVAERLMEFIGKLVQIATVHDNSKFEEPERSIYAATVPRFKGVEYGTEEYKAITADLGPAWAHHQQNNSHHLPLDKMNLIDLIEALCDWQAANQQRDTGEFDIEKSARGAGEQLLQILKNTVEYMEGQDELV